MVFVVMTFYMDNAYFNLLGSKAYIFYWMAILYAIFMLFWERSRLDGNYGNDSSGRNKKITLLDGAVIAFTLVALVSTLFSNYKADALWGHYGWAVGSLYLLANAAIYFWTSRRMRWKAWMHTVITISASIVFLWALTDECYLDIFKMHDPIEAETAYNYLASIGNNNWFSGYWALVVPFFLFGIKKGSFRKNVLLLAGLFLSVFVGVSSRADSIYLGFGVILAISLLRAIGCGQQSLYTGISWMVMGLAMLSAKGVRRIIPMIELDEIALKMIESKMWLVLFAVGVLLVAFPKVKAARYVKLALIVLGICGLGIGIYTQAGRFGDNWGTGRGATWILAWKAFAEGGIIDKIFGIGPDCFGHAYRTLTGSSLFRNAHNEYLQYLVTMGVTGLISYMAIYVGALLQTFGKKAEEHPVKIMCITSVLAYAAQAVVNNPQALNGAIFFTVLAILRGVDYTNDNECALQK